MKIVEYLIPTQIYVKPEITKLSPWPIKNTSDNFYIIIPTVTSPLPDNVMFIQETLIVDPHSSAQYIPKFVKLGMNLSQSFAVKIPSGVKIRLLVIDDVRSMSITETSVMKNTAASSMEHLKEEQVVVLHSETGDILSAIDKKLNGESMTSKADDNSATPIVNEIELEPGDPIQAPQQEPVKRKRGRPPKHKQVDLSELL